MVIFAYSFSFFIKSRAFSTRLMSYELLGKGCTVIFLLQKMLLYNVKPKMTINRTGVKD